MVMYNITRIFFTWMSMWEGERMQRAKYLVTGGAGFIGSHIAEELLNRGEAVRVFDNLTTGKETNLAVLKGPVECIHGDLRNFDEIKAAVGGVEVVIYQGGLGSVQRSI